MITYRNRKSTVKNDPNRPAALKRAFVRQLKHSDILQSIEQSIKRQKLLTGLARQQQSKARSYQEMKL
eukprot:12322146-Alexandrium_andersonii.AAC.1